MPKCNFNKVAKQLYWHCTSAWVFSCKFAARKSKQKTVKAQVKKSAILLKIYYFSSTFQRILLGLKQIVLLFIETSFVNTALWKINLYPISFFSQLFALWFFSTQKAGKDKIIRFMFRNNLLRKNTVGESGLPSQLQKEKRRSAKFDVSKVLFLDIGKVTPAIG